jgi:hypothetical protein
MSSEYDELHSDVVMIQADLQIVRYSSDKLTVHLSNPKQRQASKLKIGTTLCKRFSCI